MGRLFWKFIFAFWLAFAAVACTIAATVWVIHHTQSAPEDRLGLAGDFPQDSAHLLLDTAASILSHASANALSATLSDWRQRGVRPAIYVVDASGRELLGRPLPSPRGEARTLRGLDGQNYTLLLPAPPSKVFDSSPPPHGSPFIPILSALLLSLGFSAWLAWYLAKPIRILRQAFHAVAQGKLDTRVQALMGHHRDEVSDLGHDFDRMAQQLQNQITAQQRLLHDVSHELRSPLARMQAAIGLARQNPARYDQALTRIEHESERLDALVSEVLTLARLEAGVQGLPHEQVDLIELLTVIVDDAQFEAEARERNVRMLGDGVFVLECKAELLYRSFENVIRNAVKYTAPGSTVTVTVLATPGELQISVADHGPGVSSDHLQDIFDPFYRGGSQQETPGFGLGLAIARRAIESHAGRIWAQEASLGGLVMQIRIPRRVQDSLGS